MWFSRLTSGDWSDTLTWEEYIPNIGWIYPASQIPNIGHGAINIRAGHVVDIRSFDVTAKQLTVDGTLQVTDTLQVSETLNLNGTLINNGTTRLNWFTIKPGGAVSGNDFVYDKDWRGTILFNSSYNVNDSTVFWPRQNGPANVTVSRSVSVTVNAARAVSDVLQIDGTLQVADTLTTNKTVGGGTLQVDGTLIANGRTNVRTLLVAGTATNHGTMENFDTYQISGTLINNGTTTSYGTYQVSGTLINNGTATLSTCNVSGTLTNHGTTKITFTFQLDQGGAVNGNDLIYNENGTLVFNNSSGAYDVSSRSVYWPKTNGPANVTLQGAGGITMNVARAVQQFETAAAVTNADSLTISGTVVINAGGSFDSSPTYNGATTLIYGANGSYDVGMEWGSETAVGAGVPMNVIINNGATVNMPSSPRTCPGYLRNYGTLVLSTTPGADLSVGGDWENDGTFLTNSRAVIFNGTTEQTIGPARRMNTFDYLTVNNPAGILVQGQPEGEEGDEEIASVSVHETLTFTVGNIRLRLGLLILSGPVSGSSINRHVVTYEKGRVVRAIAGGDSFQFPIGSTEVSYNPLTIALDPTDSTETFSVRVDSTVASNDSLFVQRTWDIQEETPGDNHAALTFQWAGAEEGAKFIRNASSTYLDDVELVRNSVASGTDPYSVSTTEGFPCTEFSSYTVGTPGNLTAVEESQNGIPTSYVLGQNYPNPFNPTTTIQFSVPRQSHVRLKVYNSFGAEVDTLVDQHVAAGTYKVNWDASRLATGFYLYRLEAEGFAQTKKLLLMK